LIYVSIAGVINAVLSAISHFDQRYQIHGVGIMVVQSSVG
jgi:hypothetical protein